MHRLLRRQLARRLGADAVPEALKDFVASVDEAYRQADEDRAMLLRSLELSSDELLNANAQMEAILRAIPDLFLHVNQDAVVVAHRGGPKGRVPLLGAPRRGTRLQDLFPSRVTSELLIAVGQGLCGQSPPPVEYAMHAAKNQFFEARVMPFKSSEVLVMVRDVTDRVIAARAQEKQLEERARARMLREFAHVASHDLRAPLRGIKNLASFITDDLEAGLLDDVKKHARTLNARVTRMEDLLSALLEYSEVGRRHAPLERVDCGELVRGIATVLAPPEGFEIRVDESMPVLHTAKSPLERVFLNLITNALKHHDKETGCIDVRGRTDDGHAVFEVADDGPGIAEERREKAFGMFKRLDHRREGNGMGLALVRRIVENAGGVIVILDNEPRGARFRFQWPMAWPHADQNRA